MTGAADDVRCMARRAVDMTLRLTGRGEAETRQAEARQRRDRGSQARPPLPRLLPRWHASMCYLVCWYVGMLARWYVGGCASSPCSTRLSCIIVLHLLSLLVLACSVGLLAIACYAASEHTAMLLLCCCYAACEHTRLCFLAIVKHLTAPMSMPKS
jgi:hypothetical protein